MIGGGSRRELRPSGAQQGESEAGGGGGGQNIRTRSGATDSPHSRVFNASAQMFTLMSPKSNSCRREH